MIVNYVVLRSLTMHYFPLTYALKYIRIYTLSTIDAQHIRVIRVYIE